MRHDWSFRQMAAARKIIFDNYLQLMPSGYVSPGYRPTFQEVEAMLQTIIVSQKTYSDLLQEMMDLSRRSNI